MRRWFSCLVLGLVAAPALAQAPDPSDALKPTEGVIVTAPKIPPEKVLHDFVVSYTAPSPASGKVARWHGGVCPGVAGLPDSWNNSVAARVREVASQAGAPVADAKCHPNIDIVFTRNPQALLDEVRAKKSWFLGYHDLAREKDLATVRHAIQAWYMTQTVGARGDVYTDDKLHTQGITFMGGKNNSFQFPNAHVESWNGSRLTDDRRSELAHVLVVVDLVKVNGIKLSAVVDDVAMLALAQTKAFEDCQPIPSIANLTTADCAFKTDSLSPNDQAYLHALYKIQIRASLVQQWGDIAYEMKKSLGAP